MVVINGPKFRSAKVYPDRKLTFNYKRKLPFGKKGLVFRKKGILFRKNCVSFGKDGVSNIDFSEHEEPNNLNNKGIEYYNKGKYKIALKFFSKALLVAPQFNEARINREYCYQMIKAKKKLQDSQTKSKATKMKVSSSSYDFNHAKEVKPIDYTKEKYNQLDQYGRIIRKNENTKDSSYYGDELGWTTPNKRR